MIDLIFGFCFVSLIHFGVSELVYRVDCLKFKSILALADILAVMMMGLYTVLILEELLK